MKKLFQAFTAVSFLVCIILTIVAFVNSWKGGILCLLGSLFFIAFLGSFIKKENEALSNQNPRKLKPIVLIIAIVCFTIGINISTKKEKPENSSEKSDEKVEISIDRNKLSSFQKGWIDSVVKSWEGSFIVKGYSSKNLDSIYFLLSKAATKGNWRSAYEINQSTLQNDYDSAISKSREFLFFTTSIAFMPDSFQEQENEAVNNRKRLINRQFSGWDGANIYVERAIKQNMNDPDSYEHIQTTYADKGKYILVQTRFRGTNAFGAKVITIATAKVDLEGNILSLSF